MQFPRQCKLGSCLDMSSVQSVRGTYRTALVIYLSLSRAPPFLSSGPLTCPWAWPTCCLFLLPSLSVLHYICLHKGVFIIKSGLVFCCHVLFCFVKGFFLQCKWQPRYNQWLWVMASLVPPFYTTWAPCSLPWWWKGSSDRWTKTSSFRVNDACPRSSKYEPRCH